MKPTDTETRTAVCESIPKTNPHTTTSKDGRWRTFHKHAGLMQFIPSGAYFARVKVNGKVIRCSLKTSVFSDAKLLLADKQREFETRRETKEAPAQTKTFAEARALY